MCGRNARQVWGVESGLIMLWIQEMSQERSLLESFGNELYESFGVLFGVHCRDFRGVTVLNGFCS